jgi:hypothetical protein
VPPKARGWSALCVTAMLAAAGASPAAAAERGIELLSTGGNDPADVQLAMAAADGRSALLQSRGSIGGAEPDGSGGADDVFWSRRGAGGWSFSLATPNTLSGAATQPLRMTPDGSSFIVASGERLDPAADTDSVMDLYRYDNGTYTLLTGAVGAGTDSDQPIDRSVWVSDDLTRIIFSTKSHLLAADDALVPPPPATTGGRDIYQWLDGTLSLISVNDAAQTTAAGDAQISGSQGGFVPPSLALFRNMVSTDGGTVFFVTNRQLDPADTDTANDVYARIGGNAPDTVLVSDGPSALDPNSAADFAGASSDGTTACFTTTEKIVTTGAGNDTDSQADLHCRTLPGGTPTRVSLGALGGTSGNLNTANAPATALAVTDDASRVFFLSKEKLTSDAPAVGTPVIYVAERGVTKLVAPLVAGEEATGFAPLFKLLGPEPLRPWRMTPDGGTAVFVTAAKVRPDIDTDNAADVYRWKDGMLPELLSAGTELPATLATGYSGIQESSWAIGTADLSRIVFQTAQPLVAEDTDTFVDVYEHTADGIKLVSNGPSDADVLGAGVSPNGEDVYLQTFATLLPEDGDQGQQDVYVAKAGGGFPASGGASGGSAGPGGGGGALPGLPSLPKPTSAVPTPGADAPPAHSGSSGGGSPAGPTPPFEATVGVVKGNSALLLVLQPPSAGRVEAEVTARIGGKWVRIGRVSRAVKAGDTSLRVGLSRSARRQLRQAGALKASVRVRFVPGAGRPTTVHLAITLRSPESKR